MPRITKNPNSNDSRLEFTLSDVDVAYANGIRRTIIADIPIIVFRTSPYERNKCEIINNTSRLNNEIIKQRLSCIPICNNNRKEYKSFIDNHILEINVENNTDESLTVTTKDFRIKNISTGEYLSDSEHREIFPPYIDSIHGSEHYIQFVRLRSRISNEIPGEKINLTCRFDIGTSKEDSSFNVAGTCTYKRTPDKTAISQELHLKEAEFKSKGLNDDEIKFEMNNWKLLDGMRMVVPNSFDFIIETIGIFSNEKLVSLACTIIHTNLQIIREMLINGEVDIEPSNNTKPNCFEIYFKDYDYTIGNIINHQMYELFFLKTEQIHSVSVKKIHPHDNYITMEVSIISDENPIENLIRMLVESCESAEIIVKTIRDKIKTIKTTEE